MFVVQFTVVEMQPCIWETVGKARVVAGNGDVGETVETVGKVTVVFWVRSVVFGVKVGGSPSLLLLSELGSSRVP